MHILNPKCEKATSKILLCLVIIIYDCRIPLITTLYCDFEDYLINKYSNLE